MVWVPILAVSVASRRLRGKTARLGPACCRCERWTYCKASKSIPTAINTLGEISGWREVSIPWLSWWALRQDSSSQTDACVTAVVYKSKMAKII